MLSLDYQNGFWLSSAPAIRNIMIFLPGCTLPAGTGQLLLLNATKEGFLRRDIPPHNLPDGESNAAINFHVNRH